MDNSKGNRESETNRISLKDRNGTNRNGADHDGGTDCEEDSTDLNNEREFPNEGELLRLAISRKIDEIARTNCGSIGSMRKNGGSGPMMRAWTFKICNKHMTGQNVPMALEE